MKKIFILIFLLILNVFVCSGEIKTVTLTLGGDAVGWYQDYKYSLTDYYPLTMKLDGCSSGQGVNIMLNGGYKPIAERVFLQPSGTQDICLDPELEKGGEYYITHCFGPNLRSQITGAYYCLISSDCSTGIITIQASVDEDCRCTPSCSGKECGSDGCGGSCGTCGSGETCSSGQCISTCTSHSYKACYGGNVYWFDSCGNREGVYEYCSSDEICSGGSCVSTCTPSCYGKECGSDGCGGSCGTCGSGYYCSGGSCVSESYCGDGSCNSGESCSNCPSDCGSCAPSCYDECDYSGQRTCYGTNGYKTCGYYDSDSCLEWSGVNYCSTGYECSSGSCVARQSSQSTSGQGASSQSSSSRGTYSQSSYQGDEKNAGYYFLWFLAGMFIIGFFIWRFKKSKKSYAAEDHDNRPNIRRVKDNQPNIKRVKETSTKKKIEKYGIRRVD